MKKTLRFAGILSGVFLVLIATVYVLITNNNSEQKSGTITSKEEARAIVSCVDSNGKIDTILGRRYCKFEKPLKLCEINAYGRGECGPRSPLNKTATGTKQ